MSAIQECDQGIVDEELAKNPNWIVFQKMLTNNEFCNLPPNTYIAFCNLEIIGMGLNDNALISALNDTEYNGKGICIFPANATEDIVEHMPTLFED